MPPFSFSLRAVELRAVIGLAVAVGLLHVLPGLFLQSSLEASGLTYLPLQITHHGDTLIYYATRAREVADGHWPTSDLYIPAYKSGPYIFAPVPQLLFGGLIAAFGDVTAAYHAALFLFTALLFLAFWAVGRVFLPGRIGAVFFALVGALTPLAIHLPRAFYSPQLFADIVAKNFLPIVRTPLPQLFLARIEDPLLTLSFHLLALIFLYRFWLQPSVRRAVILAAAWGLLLYIFYIYFAFLSVLIGLLFGWHLLRERGRGLAPWLILFGLIAVAALPFLTNSVAFRALPQQPELLARFGLEFGRAVRLSVWDHYLAYLITAGLAWLAFRRSNRPMLEFSLASLLTLVMLWNIQLVLGFNLPPDHWTKAEGPALFIILAVLIAALASKIKERMRQPWLGRVSVALLLILSSLLLAKKVVNAAWFRQPSSEFMREYSFPAEIIASWRWINQHVPRESVVLSNSYVSTLYLTAYTSTNSYLVFGENSIASGEELALRFLTVHKLFATPPRSLAEYLTYRKRTADVCSPCDAHTAFNLSKAPRYLFGHAFNPQSRFDALTKDSAYAIPTERISAMLERYQTMEPRFEDFPGAYVYAGPWERELSQPDLRSNPALEPVYDQGGVEIYRVR